MIAAAGGGDAGAAGMVRDTASEAADPVGAFCRHDRARIAGAARGPLRGLDFAAKDVFDVEGVTACFGNPTWRDTHAPASRTAPVIAALVDAGATLAGLTLTDELALSLTGENAHYGTPINARCPDRVPGGSSSGSAAAVAAGLVDFALGTDTGGSVRVPASHCGVYGFRPTHGAVDATGVLPLAPRFDTVGWFARDAATLARVGAVLLDGGRAGGAGPSPAEPPAGRPLPQAGEALGTGVPPRLLRAGDDALGLVDARARSVFRRAAALVAHRLRRDVEPVAMGARGAPVDAWLGAFLALQNAEAAALHGAWIARWRPRFGSLIAGRFTRLLAVDADAVARGAETRAALVERAGELLGDGGGAWLIWPSAVGPAPRRGLPDAETDAITGRALALGALAGLLGLPQVSLPLAEVDGCPFGISLIGPRGSDRALLAAATHIQAQEDPR
jgi:amidase